MKKAPGKNATRAKKSVPRKMPLIALSAGGNDDELATYGVGLEHVDELMVRVAKKLLSGGNRLAFGGTLVDAGQQLTQSLIETAQNWLHEDSAQQGKVTRPQTWPLVNYSAWPFHTFISEEQRANLVGVCRFIDVNPAGSLDSEPPLVPKDWKVDPHSQIGICNSLSRMRDISTVDAALRIAWAGKIDRALGWMPGILEEVGYSLAQKKPVLILGGYGGCAGLIAKFLAKKDKPWPKKLAMNRSLFGHLDKSDRQPLEDRFDQIKTDLTDFRKRLHKGKALNGLPAGLVSESLLAENGHRLAMLVAEAATEVGGKKSAAMKGKKSSARK